MTYAVCVTFTVEARVASAFRSRVARQAEDSLTEDGCLVFDVWANAAAPATVYLYEVYRDRAAFDAHLASHHFLAFDSEIAPWVIEKVV